MRSWIRGKAVFAFLAGAGVFYAGCSDQPAPVAPENPGGWDWEKIVRGTSISNSGGWTEVCTAAKEGGYLPNTADSCVWMEEQYKYKIREFLTHSRYRVSEYNCAEMKSKMEMVLLYENGGARGPHPPSGATGLAFDGKGVWFNDRMFDLGGDPMSEYTKHVNTAHEAYHLVWPGPEGDEPSNLEGPAEIAGKYCFNYDDKKPAGW